MDVTNTRLYHRSGAAVSIALEGSLPEEIDKAIQGFLDAGFTVLAPGLEEGEQKEEVGFVVRREKFNQDKSVTPIVDLYANHDAMKHPILSIYLNTQEDVSAFEVAAGTRLISLPLYEGEGRIERGKNPRMDAKVWRANRPFGVVFTKNPKYDEAEDKATKAKGEVYGVPKRKFVRWAEAKVPAKEPAKGTVPFGHQPQHDNGKPEDGFVEIRTPSVEFWQSFLKTSPDLEEFNKAFREAFLHLTPAEKKHPDSVTVYNKAKKYAEDPERAWEFDTVTKRWEGPKDAPDVDNFDPSDPVPF